MRSQHPGISRPRPTQQQGLNDMQLWQQQLMYKQLAEVQRQRQLQEAPNARQAANGQAPPVLSGMPISNASNYMWPSEHMGGEPKATNNSLMFLPGNVNWAQQQNGPPPMHGISSGFMFPHDQGQAMRPKAFVQQPGEHSLYGTPVSNARYSSNQSFQGAMLGNFQQVNPFSRGVQAQDYQGVQEQDHWLGKLQENKTAQAGSSRGAANLDPAEEKLLFGSGNDGNWESSIGDCTNTETGGYHHVNPMQSNDQFGAYPSLQSGSWSALMLDALDASSSDTGLQEEWSGLSFQKTEPSTRNHYAFLNDNENNLQSASSLAPRPLHLLNDTDASPSNRIFPTKFAYEQNETVPTDASRESSQQSSKEANYKQLDPGHRQNSFVGRSLQEQTPPGNVSNGGWAGQMYGHDGTEGHTQRNDINETMYMGRDRDGNAWQGRGNQVPTSFLSPPSRQESVKSDIGSPKMRSEGSNTGNFAGLWKDSSGLKLNQEVKQQVSHQNQLDYGKHVTLGSSQNYKGAENVVRYQNQLSRSQQVRDSSMHNSEKNEVGQKFNHTQESSSPRDNEGAPRENSMLTQNYSGRKSSGQADQNTMGPQRSQYHPPGSLEMALEPADSCNNVLYSQGHNHSVVRGPRNQKQGHVERSEFSSLPPNSIDSGKEHFTDLQRTAKAADEAQPSGTLPNPFSASSSFDGSASHAFQNQRLGQASHNMLELLNKVDQSRNNPFTHFSLSDRNGPSEIPKNTSSQGSSCLQRDRSSVLQGFGLKLAPPSQWQPVLDNDLTTQSSLRNDIGTRNLDSGAGDKERAWSSSFSSAPSPPLVSQVTKNDNFDNRSNNNGPMNKQTSYSGAKGNPSGPSLMDRSANLSVGSQVNVDAHVKPSSHPSQAKSSNDGNVFDQPAQGSLPSVTSRIPPPRPNTSLNSRPSQPINSSSLPRSSGQQLHIGETRSAAQPSTTSGMSQQGGFSSMLHKVWSGLSPQQRQSIIQAQKIIPKLPHSAGPLPNSMDTNLVTPHRADDQNNKVGGSALSRFGTCSTNSQQFMSSDKVDASEGQDPVSVSSLVRPHHQELNRGKHALEPEEEHVSVSNADAQKQNYSLLKQVQDMKGSDSDPSNRAWKRLRGAEVGAGQSYSYGQDTVFREFDETSQQSTFPSDVKMLSFSRENEDERMNTSSQLISREKASEDLLNIRHNDLRNHTHSLSKISTIMPSRGNERPPINSQMASFWVEQYRSYKNGQVIAKYDGPTERMDNNSTIMKQRDDANQVGDPAQNAVSTALPANESSSSLPLPLSAIDNNEVLIPKKRKTATSELLPWRKEVTEGPRRLLNIRIANQDWAKASNRLIEKVEDELEMIVDGSPTSRARRRLVLTTQLMQQLLPSIPATFLREDVAVSYESVTYFVSKLALGGAFGLISCAGRDSIFHLKCQNMISENVNSSEKVKDHFLVEKAEGFIGKTRKLESDFVSLERTTSMLDVRVECHELDRCSIVNRLAKFHGQAQTEGVKSSPFSDLPPSRISPQRHVTPQAEASILPEGVRYLSL